MSAWIVYSKDGLTERCELHAVEYGGTHMGERAVTATFESDSKVDFDIFDYLSYRGEVFELESVPTVKKTSSFEYSYELRFVSRKYELERCEMRDLVPSDNGVVYHTPLSFSFTGDVRYLTDRIQACLDDLYGEGVWNIVIADGVESEEKNITIAQQNCWNALALVNSTYGLDFYIKGRVITIGGSQPVVSHVFEYGKGNGLYEIERAANTDTAIVTKLRAYGSDRNLDYSYPKKPEWSDSNLPVSFAFSPLRLMLPSFKVDKTDYVLADEKTIKKYGIREASIVYEDIYPSITGATHNGQAIDEIKAVEEVDDNASTFVVYLYDLGFDLEEHLTTTDAQISMKSGAMQGYTFTISNIEKQYEKAATFDISNEENPEGETPEEDLGEFVGYKITLNRMTADGGENYNIPNSDWNMREGDKFVLLNILMPQKYIREAENRLKQRAEEYLAQYSETNFGYNIGLHDKFLIENPSVYDALIEGSKLSVYDEELGISEDVTIQSITITENAADNTLPQVKVTLNNEPSASTLDRIQGKIDSLANESAANNFATQSEIMAQYRKKLDKPFFDKLFAAVDAEGNEIPSTDTVTPVAYIKARYDFAVVGGVTMYLNDGSLDLPNIFDGLPIDNDTIYWDGKVLKSRGVGEGGVTPTLLGDLKNVGSWANTIATEDRIMVQKKDGSSWEALELSKIGGSASFENVKESGEGNAYTSFTLSDDKKTLAFNKGETFAKQSDFSTLKTKVTDFLEGSDTDSIINKWKELEAFLSGMKESDDLATILSTKWTKDDSKIANWDTAFLWGDHSKAGYFKSTDFTKSNIKSTLGISDWALSSVKPSYTTKEVAEDTNLYFTNQRAVSALADTLKGYVTLSGTQTISGEKNFTGGLKVNGQPIVYDARGFWRLDGDLLVTGGITMFGSDSSFSPSTITQAVNVDGTTIINDGKKLMLNPDIQLGGGGVTDYNDLTGRPDLSVYALKTSLSSYQTKITSTNKLDYGLISGTPTIPTNTNQLTNGAGFITSSGSITGNAATATALKTPITLWGNLFDGSADIKNSDITLYQNESSYTGGWSRSVNARSSSGTILGEIGFYGVGENLGYAYMGGTYSTPRITVFADGRVGIGTTTPQYEFDVNGSTRIKGTSVVRSVRPELNNSYNLGDSSYLWANIYTKKTNIDGVEIKKSANGVLYIGGNLVVSGGITMYGTDGTTANTIWDDAPIANTNGKKGVASYDPNFFAVENGVVKFIGQTGGGVADSVAWGNVTGKPTWIGSNKPSYTTSEVTEGTNLYFTNARAVSALSSTLSNYLTLSGGTLTDKLTGTTIVAHDLYWREYKNKTLSSGGWYRFATSTRPDSYGNTYILSICRVYNSTSNESYLIAVTLDYSGCSFTQLAGHRYSTAAQLVTKIRCTRTHSGDVYFDFYYTGSSKNTVYVNAIGHCKVQTPEATNSTLTYTDEFSLEEGVKSSLGFIGDLKGNADTATSATTATTASKLSTVSKTAWGQTYWTSGGVPTNINGDMSNVGHITMKGNNSYDIGTSSVGVRYIYANWIGAISGGKFSIGANKGTAITILTDQKIGIGTKNPSTALQVDQSEWSNGITINRTISGGGGAIAVRSNGTHVGNFGISGSKQFEFSVMSGTSEQVKMTVDSSGNGLFYGGVTMYSDLRKKTILNHVELSLKEVADAPLIEHYYNSDEKKTTHVGSVAQYWAGLNDWFCKEDEEGYLTMEIQNAALASAISVARELTRYESKTDKQIKKLKKRIGELEEEIETLKKV